MNNTDFKLENGEYYWFYGTANGTPLLSWEIITVLNFGTTDKANWGIQRFGDIDFTTDYVGVFNPIQWGKPSHQLVFMGNTAADNIIKENA